MVPNADQSGCVQNYVTDAIDGLKIACNEIGGTMSGQKRCRLNICYKDGDVENFQKVQELCHVVSENSGLPAGISIENDICYCGI